ncbi:MAG: hypothetical protein HC822_08215 [Oscillochloris sp.]|nr:hypothetical protein [Oscillochloris sp.]
MLVEHPPLLHTRLFTPPVRRATLARSALIERLSVPEAQLLLLSAPAGFGKTTLLASWCHALAASDVAISWLTLESGDNEPLRFLSYLHAALARIPLPIPQPEAWAGGLHTHAIEHYLTHVLNALISLDRAVLLVLDDYHVIHAPEVHLAVAFLLDHLPPHIRLVIGSRADPPLPLARLRAHGGLVELRAADLRFSHQEIRHFFMRIGIELSAEALQHIDTYVEGWPAGVQLVALTMQTAGDQCAGLNGNREAPPDVDAQLSDSRPHLFAYLAEDVFAGQPAYRKAFLLQTAILDQLCGPLCDAVLGIESDQPSTDSYSRLILEELDHANLFVISVDGERRWFRYHQLFRAFLRERLEREQSDTIALLHRRASHWYARQEQLLPAFEHALVANDPAQAAELITRIRPACSEHAAAESALIRARSLAQEHGAAPLAQHIERELARLTAQARQLHQLDASGTATFDALSERELEVLRLVAEGASNQTIAATLCISIGTVKSHLNHILSKLDARSRTEAVARARTHKILPA